MKEIWKPIKDYEGLYEISNFGRVKSLKRKGRRKEKILKYGIDFNGYKTLRLSTLGKLKTFYVHRLVWDYFGNACRCGRILQIDHIDNNKLNNKIDNLQLLTNRKNVSKSYKNKKTTSEYTGVSWDNENNKWKAQIYMKGKGKNLGRYTKEYDAHLAYQEALNKLSTRGV